MSWDVAAAVGVGERARVFLALEVGEGGVAESSDAEDAVREGQRARKICARCSRIGTDIGAVVTELAAPLSAISALRRRNVFTVDTNWRRSTSRGDDEGREGGAASGRRPWRTPRARSVRPLQYACRNVRSPLIPPRVSSEIWRRIQSDSPQIARRGSCKTVSDALGVWGPTKTILRK